MFSRGGTYLCRVLFTVLVGLLVALAGLPEAAKVHVASPEILHLSHNDKSKLGDRHTESASTFGHCHPGLDCFTVAAFLLSPSLPSPSPAGEAPVWFARLESDRWIPLSDKPPPRLKS